MPIKVITFDLDNTLWDVEPALYRAEAAQNNWLREHRPGAIDSLDDAQLFEFKKQVWKRHPELAHHVSKLRTQAIYELQLAAGYDETSARQGADEAFAVFLHERHQVELYHGALEVLAQLASVYRIGALTNGNADIYKTAAAGHFEFAFLAEDVGASKPHPALFEAAATKTAVDPEEIVHVGDDPVHDIEGAKKAGMFAVWMNARGKAWQGDTPADSEIRHLSELPDALTKIDKLHSA